MHESLLDYRRYRYLWVSLLLCSAAIGLYLWDDPVHPRSGGTWLGYTLGGTAAALIVWLTLLGLRKRAYKSRLGNLRGWTSAHIYLGVSVLVISTLHCAFQYGWNLHTLAYVLMVMVIITGIWGVVMYRRNPELVTRNRGGQTRLMMIDQLNESREECLRRADEVGVNIHETVRQALDTDPLVEQRWRDLLAGRYWVGALGRRDSRTLQDVLAERLSSETDGDRIRAINRLLDMIGQRRRLSQRLARDLKLQAWMEFWLYLHVPLSLALLAALMAHIVSVFFYW